MSEGDCSPEAVRALGNQARTATLLVSFLTTTTYKVAAMYILKEYAALTGLALLLGAVLVAISGLGYMLALAGATFLRASREFVSRADVLQTVLARRSAVQVWIPRRSSVLVMLLLLVQPVVSNAQKAASPQPTDVPFTFNVSVDEVVLHATVKNREGASVAGRHCRIAPQQVPLRARPDAVDDAISPAVF